MTPHHHCNVHPLCPPTSVWSCDSLYSLQHAPVTSPCCKAYPRPPPPHPHPIPFPDALHTSGLPSTPCTAILPHSLEQRQEAAARLGRRSPGTLAAVEAKGVVTKYEVGGQDLTSQAGSRHPGMCGLWSCKPLCSTTSHTSYTLISVWCC